MVHTREMQASAAEIKFLIHPSVGPRVREWARAHLDPDPHGTGPSGDEYETASLYFDTRRFDVFHRRESFGRAKYRVRRYGDSDVAFLERKLRKPGVLIKRRTIAPLESLTQLVEPGHESVWGGNWFRRRLQIRRLRPVCQITYHRTARVAATADGPARLTLDCDMRAAQADDVMFAPRSGVPFLEDRMILELKYGIQLPALFRRLIEEFGLRTQTASKYRVGMSALGHVPASDEPPVLSGSDISYA